MRDEATTYDYKGLNQLIGSETKETKVGKGEVATSHKTYTYDRDGNQIGEKDSVTGQSKVLGYDAANRLSRYAAKEGDAVVLTQENLYNGNGQRIQKKEVKGQETKENHYYYYESGVLYTMDLAGENSEPDTLHLYAYCANNPINFVDPSGHDAIWLNSKKGACGQGHAALLFKAAGSWRYFNWLGETGKARI